MLLIVNADDLGATETVNEEVFKLMEAGLVTSATLLANGPAFDHAAASIHRFPSCSFGVHLNLTDFAPLSDPNELKAVLSNGLFCRELLTRRAVLALRKQLTRELSAQVQRVIDAGIRPTHLDSHHFIHLRADLFPIIKAIQRKFGIRALRSSVRLMAASRRKQLYGKIMKLAVRKIYATSTPDAWCEFSRFYSALAQRSLPQFRCLELMVHPGSLQNCFANENSLLRSGWQRLLPAGVELASYHVLQVA